MTKAANLIGQQFGKLTVLHRFFDNDNRYITHAKWVCQCECGNQIVVLATNLKKQIKGIKSCGCYTNQNISNANSTHGLYHTPERFAYSAMLDRCLNKNNKDYPNYGGRGITVCDRWLGKNGLINFVEDMGKKPFADASLERKDVNLGYSKENCVWIKHSLQAKNRNYNKIRNKDHADQIREEYSIGKISMSQLAILNNCSITCISYIILIIKVGHKIKFYG